MHKLHFQLCLPVCREKYSTKSTTATRAIIDTNTTIKPRNNGFLYHLSEKLHHNTSDFGVYVHLYVTLSLLKDNIAGCVVRQNP